MVQMAVIEEVKEGDENAQPNTSTAPADSVPGKGPEPWHWTEVDMKPQVEKKLEAAFASFKLVDSEDVIASCTTCSAYGDALGGTRKGKAFVVLNFKQVDVSYYGRAMLRGSVVGDTIGMFRIKNVSTDTDEDLAEDWEVEHRVGPDYPKPCMPGAPPPPALSPVEMRIKTAVEETAGASLVKRELRRIISELRGEEPTEADVAAMAEAQSKEAAAAELKKIKSSTGYEELRRSAMPKKYHETISTLRDGKGGRDAPAEVYLSFCDITDADIPDLVAALQCSADIVEEIDLSRNAITDSGTQVLVTQLVKGALPKLKQLRIDSNKLTNAGHNILKGLSIMRKTIKVRVDPVV
jgi:hypothetical protein